MVGHSFISLTFALTALLDGVSSRHVFRHEAIEVQRRQASSADLVAVSSTAGTVLTYITPSPGAPPIPVTSQSQLVSSNVPEFTLCALPPEAFIPVTETPTTSTAPYHNYSISIPPGQGTCTTIYSPTVTMVCATTLSGLDREYKISSCGQEITFSSEYGYVLATPTATPTLNATSATATNATALITPPPPPTIQTLTTYYVAPWQELTSAGAPQNVDRRVCTTFANGTEDCVVEYYVWHTSLVTIPATTVVSVNLTTTIAGPSQLIVETFVANVTEKMTTFSMSTTMALEYSIETATTNVQTRPSVPAGSTVYETWTLDRVTTRMTSTSTRRITTTIYVPGTLTKTMSGVHVTSTSEPMALPSTSIPAIPSLPSTSVPAAPALSATTSLLEAVTTSYMSQPSTSLNVASILGLGGV